MRKLVKVSKPEWRYGYGIVPARYELHDETTGYLGSLICQERGYSWVFQPNPLRVDQRHQRFTTFREARKELTRDGG